MTAAAFAGRHLESLARESGGGLRVAEMDERGNILPLSPVCGYARGREAKAGLPLLSNQAGLTALNIAAQHFFC